MRLQMASRVLLLALATVTTLASVATVASLAPAPAVAGTDAALAAHADDARPVGGGFTLYPPAGEAVVSESGVGAIAVGLMEGRNRIEAFFGQPLPRDFDVRVFATRRALDAHWRAAWKMRDLESECWMVASGTASELAILSPDAWAKEACEHDPADEAHLNGLLAHELTHVYHAQHNPKPDFDGLDAIAWFAEGLAVYASGQLEEGHQATAQEAIARGAAPTALAAAWTGKYRYGVAGSLVRFVDRRVGRAGLFAMLSATTDAEILARLGMSEAELLAAWRAETAAAGKQGAPK